MIGNEGNGRYFVGGAVCNGNTDVLSYQLSHDVKPHTDLLGWCLSMEFSACEIMLGILQSLILQFTEQNSQPISL